MIIRNALGLITYDSATAKPRRGKHKINYKLRKKSVRLDDAQFYALEKIKKNHSLSDADALRFIIDEYIEKCLSI